MWNGHYWKLSGPTKEPLFFHMSFYSQSMKLMQPNCTWRKWKAEFWALSEKLHAATGLKKNHPSQNLLLNISTQQTQTSSPQRIPKKTGYHSRTVQCSLRRTEASTLTVTGNPHTHTSTCSLNPTTHWNTNTTKQRMFPLRQREKKRNKHTSKEHLKHVAIQTGPSSSQPRDKEINTGSHQPYLLVS